MSPAREYLVGGLIGTLLALAGVSAIIGLMVLVL